MKTPSAPNRDRAYLTPASVSRQLAALLYDLLAVITLWWLAAALVTLALGTGAEPDSLASRLFVPLTGLLLHLGYFCLSWCLAGQTMGMRAWKIRLVRQDGSLLNLQLCLCRAALACLSLMMGGAGWLFARWDDKKRTLHDRLCHTRIVLAIRTGKKVKTS